MSAYLLKADEVIISSAFKLIVKYAVKPQEANFKEDKTTANV